MSAITLQQIVLPASGDGAETGMLVFVDGQLTAVLACLHAPFYGAHRGRWHVEAAFGRCTPHPSTFDTLADALASIAAACGIVADVAAIASAAGFGGRAVGA